MESLIKEDMDMKFMKVLPLLIIPFFLLGCKDKTPTSSSSEEEQSLITLSHTAISLPEDRTFQLTVDDDESLKDNLVFWTIRDENIATVDNGLITALQIGSTICTVQVGKYTANCAINVTDYEPDKALNIVLAKDTFNLQAANTYVLPVTVTFGSEAISEYQLTGDSSDVGVATYADGIVTAVANGECDILLSATYGEYVANKLIYITVY